MFVSVIEINTNNNGFGKTRGSLEGSPCRKGPYSFKINPDILQYDSKIPLNF